jgi:retinol dehydrogenase 14
LFVIKYFFELDEILSESGNNEIVLHHLNLSSFNSIREFCAIINKTEPRIDVLIHNAGYGGNLKNSVSADGIELMMATNHYGPFLMTHLLIDLLKKSAPARVVVVSSKAHLGSFLRPTKNYHLNPIGFFFPPWLYCNSKMANLWFTFELARRLEGTGVTCNALHPGEIFCVSLKKKIIILFYSGTSKTQIWRNYNRPYAIGIKMMLLFLKTIEEGTQTTLHVALSNDLENVTGEYFRDCELGKPAPNARNVEMQKIFWEQSRKMVELIANDPKI